VIELHLQKNIWATRANLTYEPRVDEFYPGDGRARSEMITWTIRRLFQACFVVLAMTVIVFVGVHVIGNPVRYS